MILIAPNSYKNATLQEIQACCNGTGPEGFDRLVPDTIWLLNINLASNIHDWMYNDIAAGNGHWSIEHPLFGEEVFVKVSKGMADVIYLINILIMIDRSKGFWFVRWLRRYRAITYFNFVKDVGDFAITKAKKGEGKK